MVDCIYKRRRNVTRYMAPFFAISITWLVFFSSLVTNLYAAALHQAIPHAIAPTKTTNSDGFLTYENNSTLGVNIQYPSNWERDTFHDKVAFFAPSLAEGHNPKIIPVVLFVKVDNLPFEIESVDDYISHHVNKLKEYTEISQPIGVSLTSLAGNLAHNVTYSARLGQHEYRTIELIMLSGIKKYEITYYIAQEVKSSNYLQTIQKMIDSFEISIGITSGNPFITYQNNSTGIKIQYPSNWQRTEDDNGNSVLFISPSESISDKVLESLSIRVSASNNIPLSKLANQTINYYKQNYNDFHLIQSKLITFKHSLAYMLKYAYTDMLFGKGIGVDIGTAMGNKLYVISYFAEPTKLPLYLPTIQKMIDSLEIEKKNVSNQSSNLV